MGLEQGILEAHKKHDTRLRVKSFLGAQTIGEWGAVPVYIGKNMSLGNANVAAPKWLKGGWVKGFQDNAGNFLDGFVAGQIKVFQRYPSWGEKRGNYFKFADFVEGC